MKAPGEPLLLHARYLPGGVLGAGAQGIVLRVTDREAPERPLVAKVFRPGAFREQVLLGEFSLLARLRAPGVVRAHDLGWDSRNGAPFFVEEHVPGADAATFTMAAEPALRTVRLAQIVAEVARALAALHAAGFVHGDLKPAHVRMRPSPSGAEEAVLLDLGAAVSRAGAAAAPIAFTSAFAAPEILGGGAPSPASDLYGLGALAWTIAAGRPPERRMTRRPLRARAPWVEPHVAQVIEALAEIHPRDRPPDALDVLARLGAAAEKAGIALGALPAPLGREREIAALSAPPGGTLRYVTGPSGIGKSHLARELCTRERLRGRSVRELSFPGEGGARVASLIAFLRGGPWPFATAPGDAAPLVLVIDGSDAAPAELGAALEAYRCRAPMHPALAVLVTARNAPSGVDALHLEPLADAAFASLCGALGISEEAEIARLRDASGNVPGWLVAATGRVPLTRDTAVERAEKLSSGARRALAALAIAGGALSEALLLGPFAADRGEIAELLATSLTTRDAASSGVVQRLTAPALAADLAAALATPEIALRLAAALQEEPAADARTLLAVARSPHAGSRAAALLDRAAQRARAADLRSDEIEALMSLCAAPGQRTPERLLRLERLLRDAGMGAGYPEVLSWLEEAGEGDERIGVLALRRRAEKAARDGDAAAAQRLAEEAIRGADRLGDRPVRAFARATSGLVALMRASYEEAERRLAEAQSTLGEASGDDPEEVARMDHNAGVVAIYRGRFEHARLTFERALAVKRRLGDRAGMRSCLMNLGIALGKAERYGEARAALDEAMSLARSLHQIAGLGWCLSALADIEIRRRDAAAAAAWLASAAALSAALPAAIRADLILANAHVALLDGEGARAQSLLATVDAAVRQSDPLVDARTLAALAAAALAKLPPEPRLAARCAVRAARRARAAALPEVEAQALAILRSARAGFTIAEVESKAPAGGGALWAWLSSLAETTGAEEAFVALARALVSESGAERVLIAHLDAGGHLRAAWGADIEGLAVTEAAKRIAQETVDRALRQAGASYERDLTTPAGRGSRLAVRREALGHSALVVVEHRFRPGAFDAVAAEQAERWAALAAIALRLWIVPEPKVATSSGAGRSATPATSAPATSAPATSAPALTAAPGSASSKSAHAALSTTAVPLLEPRRAFPSIVGESLPLRRALARLDAAIDSELPVLITGETGTGKELFARALHELGPRRERELVALNCGSVPDTLFEAELFGHARGSFSGAERARPGLLARAEGGTLFLDELGELPLAKQAVLLRALEARRYRPVGSDEERAFDVRVVAATNKDLERAVQERSFRQDLLYRVNAIPLVVPPLRSREGDVALLLRAAGRRVSPPLELSERALEALSAYDWPGNVRELLHLVERLAALGVRRVELEHLPRAVRSAPLASRSAPGNAALRGRPGSDDEQREEIRVALLATRGNISRAAERVGLTRHGLKKRMARLGIGALQAWKKVS